MEQQEGLKHEHDLSRDPVLLGGCLLQKQTMIKVDGFVESAKGGPLLMRGCKFRHACSLGGFLAWLLLRVQVIPLSPFTAEGTTV